MTDAVIYLRVSSASQADDQATGLGRQLDACKTFAAGKGLEIVRVFREVYTGTELKGRKALRDMIGFLSSSRVAVVIVENMDRLARENIVGQLLIQDFQRSGVEILTASGTLLSDDSIEGKLLRNLMLVVAEYNKELLVMRMLLGRKRKRAKTGQACEGRPPFVSTAHGAVIVSMALRMANAGDTRQAIADHLNAQEMWNTKGEPWSLAGITKLIRRNRDREALLPPHPRDPAHSPDPEEPRGLPLVPLPEAT